MNSNDLHIFYDLALTIKNSKSVKIILESFIFNEMSRLGSLSAGCIFEKDDIKEILGESTFIIPKKIPENYLKTVYNIIEKKESRSLITYAHDKYFYTYRLGELGHFFMIKPKKVIKEDKFEMLVPIINKLADSLEFAIQFHQLSQAKKEAETAMKVKSDFIAVISHEIRTPLNGVLGMAQLLEDTSLDYDQKDILDKINFCAKNVLSIINDTLDFSKIEKKQIELEHIDFNIRESLERSLELLKKTYQDNNNDYSLVIDKSVPGFVNCDHGRFNQVLFNIVGNAFKFTQSGHITVHIQMRTDRELIIEITDSGIGIEEEKIKKIFTPYSQAEESISRKYGGTGLGLSISQKLIEIMGGTISVTSKVKKGTKFTYTIPIYPELVFSSSVFSVQEVNLNQKANVLVVEDNPINQDLMKRVLAKKKLNIHLAENGQVALDLILKDKKKFDLIFMDISMPVMDGLQATQFLKESLQDQLPPIIALTANTTKQDKLKATEAGMSGFVSKPFQISEIYDVLQKYIG